MPKNKKKQPRPKKKKAQKSPLSGAFLQTKEWEAFQKSVGNEVFRVEGVLVIHHRFSFGFNYAYVPRPANINAHTIDKIVAHAKKKRSVFLRIDAADPLPTGIKFKRVKDHQPATTRIVDLKLSEEDILSQMKSKTRYNMRLAKKKGVEVRLAKGVWGVRRFLKLVMRTGARHGFGIHAENYYRNMLSTLSRGSVRAHVFVARYNKKSRAAALVIKNGDAITYLHGGSSDKDKNVMAPYLLHWTIMRWAKKNNGTSYDLWGVAPEGQKNHSLSGVTRFKQGFGGRVVELPGTYERPVRSFWYGVLKFYRYIKSA